MIHISGPINVDWSKMKNNDGLTIFHPSHNVVMNRFSDTHYEKDISKETLIKINLFLNDKPIFALVDTGANICVIDETVYELFELNKNSNNRQVNLAGQIEPSVEYCTGIVKLDMSGKCFEVEILVKRLNADYQFILGTNFLLQNSFSFNVNSKMFTMDVF